MDLEKNIIFVAEKRDWVYSWVHKRFQEKLEYKDKLYDLNEYNFEVGVSNISAMASMIDAEGMKTFVLYDSNISIQERVKSASGKKIDLRNFSDIDNEKLLEQRQQEGLINYEKDWENLSQKEMFKKLIAFVG